MSTILDALRKLQREREDRDARGDLQRSVTHSFGLRPRRRIGRWIALVVLALGAGAAWYLAPAGSAGAIVASLPLPEWLGGAGQDEAEAAPEPRTTARRARPAPARPSLPPPTAPREEPTPPQSVAALNEPTSAEAEAAPPPPVPIPPPQAGAPGLRTTPLPPPATDPAPVQVTPSAPVAPPPPPSPPPATAAMQPPPPAPAPTPAAPAQNAPVQPPPATPAPTRVTQAPATTAPESAEREEARERVKKLVLEKSRAEQQAVAPTPTPATTARTPEADDGDFPAVRVHSVRWHPDKERRVARIDLAEVGPVDIHEGDIVSGLLVVRIDPGAVELQLGSAKRRVALGP